MSREHSLSDRLREAFAADELSGSSDGACPEPERLWDALHERLAPEERRLLVDHLAACAACAADWRVAMGSEAAGASGSSHRAARPASARRTRWPVLAAAAAALLVVTLLAVDRRPSTRAPAVSYRSGQEPAIHSLLEEDVAVPREAVVLRWSPVGQDARYDVEIDTTDLQPVSSARGLDSPGYRVPSEHLGGLAPGTTLVWRVEARLPDGRRVSSPAFLTRIE